jgi:NifU-like protein involved in Fe-S cluster formation
MTHENAVTAFQRIQTMLDDVYNAKILGLAAGIDHKGRLAHPDGTASFRAKLCGSTVTVDLTIDDGVVSDFAHEVKACALGQAASAIMAKHVKGSTLEALKAVRDAVSDMLQKGAPAPGMANWPELDWLEPVRDFKSRHASTLLTFDATVQAFERAIAAKQTGLTGGAATQAA